ncbi:hypothetical protein EON81_03405 [bacterium]|nr:MAG: hypothetical protein EON81_03405 [bacterium]
MTPATEAPARSGINLESFPDIGQPRLIEANGKEYVLIDADSYEALMDEVEEGRFVAAVLEGIEDADRGDVIPADEFFASIKAKYGL